MTDDTENPIVTLVRNSAALSAYAELYPDFPRRLQEAETSLRPEIRKRLGVLVEARKRSEAQKRAWIRRSMGLTPTETRLALHLANGGTVAGYAQLFGVAEGTVRSQLKSVFAKTGVNRQASLVALLRQT